MNKNKISELSTIKIPLKTIEVDIGMKKMVEWLNSFSSVQTLYCCEGLHAIQLSNLNDITVYNKSTMVKNGEPYVFFTCNNNKYLEIIVDCIGKFSQLPLPKGRGL